MKRCLQALFPFSVKDAWAGGLSMLIILLGAGFVFGARYAAGTPMRQSPVILIDPGHGGFDGGCSGRWGVLLEKELNLAVGRILAMQLHSFGLPVVLTRTDDRHLGETHRLDLLARVERARKVEAGVILCLHADWSRSTDRRGPCVFYHHTSTASRLLADMVQAELNHLAGALNQAVAAADLLVIRQVGKPAILIEMGFLSNPSENQQLADPRYQSALAEAITRGVVRFLLRIH